MSLSLLAFGVLFALMLVGVPIAWALTVVGFVGVVILRGVDPAFSMVGQIAFETPMSYDLSVVPLFILMGNLVNQAGLAQQLYQAAYSFVGHRKGGLAMATILSSGGFAAISGSSVATAATMAKVAIPSMRRYGYADGFAAATVASGGTLGILIPPSVVMVVYGILTRTDIGELFVAGILPGVLAIVLYIAAIRYTVWRQPAAGPVGPRFSWAERWLAIRPVWPVLVLFLLIIGGLYLKVFTATEGAGIGAFCALLLVLMKRALRLKQFLCILYETVRLTAVIFAIYIGGMLFANFVNLAGLTSELQSWVGYGTHSPLLVILMMVAIYFVLGCFLDSMSMIILTIPIFFPTVMLLGFDAVWFGIIVVVSAELALITPPVGMNIFVISGVFKDISSSSMFRAVTPFVIVDLIRIVILLMVPAIALSLPWMMR